MTIHDVCENFAAWRLSALGHADNILAKCFLANVAPPDFTFEPFEKIHHYCPTNTQPRALVRYHWSGLIERLAPWDNPANKALEGRC